MKGAQASRLLVQMKNFTDRMPVPPSMSLGLLWGAWLKMLPFAGGFMVAEGLVLAAHGLRLGLGPYPLFGDVAFCLAGGIGIFCTMGSARPGGGE